MTTPSSRKAQTRERIVEVAGRAIRRAGYDGVGVADIMKEAGLTHGGFYAHFPSRAALLAEAMTCAGRDAALALEARLDEARASGRDSFAVLVRSYLDDARLGDAEHGCAVAALVSEMPRQRDAVAEAARGRVLAMVDLVRRHLPAGVDPAQAQVVAATLVGSLQLARALGGPAGAAWLGTARAALITQYDSASESFSGVSEQRAD